MKTFEFAIIASGLDPHAEDFEWRFYEAGCDDATVSFQKGRIVVDFTREAEDIGRAIASAVEDVKLAGARIERVEPDPLVSLSEIAARSGLTRAAISHYAKGQRGKGFPSPVMRITSESPLWRWAAVSAWLYERRKVPKDTVVEAMAVDQANAVISGSAATVRSRATARAHESDAAV